MVAGCRLAAAMVATIVTLSVSAQPNGVTPRPKLVVGIMVDGMSMDYIELLKSYFGEDGLKRVLNQGVTLTDIDYGTPLDRTASTAMIYTGAEPSVSGIGSAHHYDRETHRLMPVFFKGENPGDFSDETYSPESMMVSTLTDELKIDGGGLGYAHTISPDPLQAIAMAGHTSNSAYWINDVSGKWVTSSYYQDRPNAMQYHNRTNPVSSRLDTLAWTPSMSVDRYPDIPSFRRAYPFSIRFLRADPNRYRLYKQSPSVNAEVTELASDYLTTLKLGQHEAIDMLNLSYTVQPYMSGKDADNKLEVMDGYIKLDRDLAKLFSAIDAGPGMENTLVFIAGTPVAPRTRRDEEKWNVPHGEFSTRRAISLLNMYLIAKFGNGEWVSGYHDNQFFLNHNLVKERGEDLNNLRVETARFLNRMAGVTYSYTIDDILDGKVHHNSAALQRNTHYDTCGDVFVTIAPGWEVVDDFNPVNAGNTNAGNHLVERVAFSTAPAFLLGAGLKPEVIETPVDARVVAPTVAGLLRIRSPNGASVAPLRLR